MKYLVRGDKNKVTKSRAHLWLGNDTACRMYSTKGIRSLKYKVYDDSGVRQICSMCMFCEGRDRWEVQGHNDQDQMIYLEAWVSPQEAD